MKINSIVDGRYRIMSLVGKGGTAVVYKALNVNLGTEWAIKEISKTNQEKFDLLVEPNLLKKLQHPSLPRIVDILENDDTFYIIEDFIDGTSLDNLLNQVEKFSEEKVIRWGKELSEVLNYLHNQQPNPVIYRDMKPGNIMLTKEGKIKLIDFGIAREFKKEVTADTVIIGTRGYASPEQYGKHQTDERSDIYSLGVTLYHLVTGRGPNDPPFEIVPIRTIDENLSEGLEHIILKCTYKDPNNRYQKVENLLYDLNNIDKLSNKYKKQERAKKIKVGIIILVFFMFNSMILGGAFSIQNEKIGEYKYQIEIADQTEKNIGLKESILEYETAIEMYSKRSDGYLSFAKAYINNMQFDKALQLLQTEAAKKAPKIKKLDEFHYLLGICLFSKGDYVGATESFTNIKNPNNFEELVYYKPIAESFSKPTSLTNGDDVIKSIDILKQSIEQSDNESFKVRGYITLADIYRDNPVVFEDGAQLQISILEKAISQSKNKNDTVLYDRLALAYYSKGVQSLADDAVAKQAFNKSLDNYNILIKLGYESETIYRNMANIYRQSGEYDRSKDLLGKVIEKYPDDYRGYIDMAFLYNAIENKKDVGSRNYNNVVNYYNLAKERNTDINNMDIDRMGKQIEILKSKGLIK